MMPEISEVEMNGTLVDEIHISQWKGDQPHKEIQKLYKYNGECYIIITNVETGKKEIMHGLCEYFGDLMDNM